MEKQSKKELLAVVERQGDQLKRYEARLRGTRLAFILCINRRAFIPVTIIDSPLLIVFFQCQYVGIKILLCNLA